MKTEKIIAISGPSGTGKTTIIKTILQQFPECDFSISATTRKIRSKEKNGVDYYFLKPDEFRQKIANNELLEYQEVYPDLYYGTLKQEIDRMWSENKIPLLDIDVFGALNIKKEYSEKCLCIFIHPGSVDTLKERLISRGLENAETFNTRIAKAETEMNESSKFDRIVFNEHSLVVAISQVAEIIKGFIR